MNSKLILLIFPLLISTIFSKRFLKEENKEEENQENECGEEETCEKETPEKLDFSNSKIRKENIPQSQVVLPIRRIGTSNMQMDIGPCGGIEKKEANTLTTKGSSINFIWEILVPENSGNCTVKISNGMQNEESFKLLRPTEGKVNEDGSFLCGREKGFEYKDFILPDDYECDGCTLQWKWSTAYGDVYSCSDIIINGGTLEKCMGRCRNGGSCFNGKCLCLEGFSGDFCEEESEQTSLAWLWYLLGILLLVGLIYLIYKYWDKIKNIFSNRPWTVSKIKEPNSMFGGNNSNENPISRNDLQQNSKASGP
jgi:Ca2+/Na+ antiporter